MAQRKPYNPNTKYGRKKLREQYELDKQKMKPEERERLENDSAVITIIIVAVIFGLIYVFFGREAAVDWATR